MNGLDLKLKRVRAGLPLSQLGRLAGVHPARISEMERDRRAIAEAVVAALDEVPGMVVQMPGMGESEEAGA